VLASKKPILGICRGAQMINVALGGTLYQDIATQLQTELSHRQTEGKFEHSHAVNILQGTPLFALLHQERIPANSFHHQAVKALGEGLAVMARADDGVVEALYHTVHPYLRLYQWHPERLCKTDSAALSVFADFVASCRK
jgi:putative glutamine amidotransferase